MRQQSPRQPTINEDDEARLPDGAETAVWVGPDSGPNDGFHLNNPQDHEDVLPDDLDLSENEEGLSPTVVFEAGDEVPLPIVREYMWPNLSKNVAVFDADGRRLDQPTHNENTAALEVWREQGGV